MTTRKNLMKASIWELEEMLIYNEHKIAKIKLEIKKRKSDSHFTEKTSLRALWMSDPKSLEVSKNEK